MRLLSTIAAVGLAAVLGASVADAAPVAAPAATLQTAVDVGPAPQVELVRGGCGWGAHRGWYGRCRLNHGWRGRYRYWHSWHHRWRRW